VLIQKLPAGLPELRLFVLRKLNTIRLKIYGDGAKLVETWSATLWGIGVNSNAENHLYDWAMLIAYHADPRYQIRVATHRTAIM
jgi:hypothetical protein